MLAVKPLKALVLAGLLSVALASAAAAQQSHVPAAGAARERSQCFFANQFQQWRDVDDKTIYIRVNLNEYYRLDMASACPVLTYPDPHLVTRVNGPDTICTALDWDLRVADGTGPGSLAVPCIVDKMTKLTPAEAAAIPKKYKPT